MGQKQFTPRNVKYWVTVASHDHILMGIKGGFAQACHGKAGPWRRTQPGDWLICYSPKERYECEIPASNTNKYQKFTAIGQVLSSAPYEGMVKKGVTYHRVDVDFIKQYKEVPWDEVKGQIKFAGLLRFGFMEIDEDDFALIKGKMLG